MSNIKSIAIKVSGLSPLNTYNYLFSNKGGNWPVKTTPLSGVFKPASVESVHEIRSYVEFCASTGLCQPGDTNVLYNDPQVDNTPGVFVDRTSLHSVLGLSISNSSDGSKVLETQTLVECDNCIPNLGVTTAENIFLDSSTNNTQQIVSVVNGLIPNQIYNYSFSSVGGNWPVKMTPASGSIKSSIDSVNINSLITLCANSADCAGSLPFVATQHCDAGQTPFSVIKLTITPAQGGYQSSVSSDFTVSCDECIPKLSVELPVSIHLDRQTKNIATLNIVANNLKRNERYTYRINGVEANWPAMVMPSSGQFTAHSDTATIPISLAFCSATGLCPSSSSDVINYTVDDRCLLEYNNIAKFVRLNVDLSKDGCANSLDRVVSTDTTITCLDCLPRVRVAMPNGASLSRETKNVYSFNADIADLIPSQKYQYLFKAVDSNWPTIVQPMSGIFFTESTTASLPVRVTFCRSTGICDVSSNVLPYSLVDQCVYGADQDKYTTLSLEVRPVDCAHLAPSVSNNLPVRCENCLPKVEATLPGVVSLSNSNMSVINFSINNLVIGKKYSYNILGLEANWPVKISPMSGNFVAVNSNHSIPLHTTFCTSATICPTGQAGILPYNINPSTYYGTNGADRRCRIIAEVESTDCDMEDHVISNESLITCGSCIPKASLAHTNNSVTLSSVGNNRYQLITQATDLIPGESYTYNVNYVDSNWPTIVSKQSGQFMAVSETKNIVTDLQFCFPSGTCANSTTEVMPYRYNNLIAGTNRYTSINLSMIDSTSINAPTISDDFTLTCSNCLPNINYSIAFSGSPTLTLPSNCCSGNQVMRVNISSAIPGDIHTYELSSSSPEVSFMPSTGTIVFRQGGSGTILSMMDTALSSGNSVIAQCKLTNTSSDIEAVDFLVIKCGSQTC